MSSIESMPVTFTVSPSSTYTVPCRLATEHLHVYLCVDCRGKESWAALLPASLRSPATGRSSERVVTNRIIAGIVGSNETACSHTACALHSAPWENTFYKTVFTMVWIHALTHKQAHTYVHTYIGTSIIRTYVGIPTYTYAYVSLSAYIGIHTYTHTCIYIYRLDMPMYTYKHRHEYAYLNTHIYT
jgi:hypothetical protein